MPADIENSFAVTQATWRFFANERVTPQALVEPLRVFAAGQLKQQVAGMPVHADTGTTALPYVLAVVDWSKLDYKKHSAKHDIVQVSNKHDIGYDLTVQLLVNAQTGHPIAPIQMLTDENRVWHAFNRNGRTANSRTSSRTGAAVAGEAIALRLVIAKVVDPVTGVELSVWHLLTNVPPDVSAETIALWYYTPTN